MLKSIYGRLIVACISLVVGFILTVGIISYNVAAKNIRQQVSNAQIDMLDQYRSKVEMLLQEVDIISCQGVLEYGSNYKEYSHWNLKEVLDTTKMVHLKAISNDIIESLYLYYPISGKIIVNNAVWTWENFYDKQWENTYKDLLVDGNDRPCWIYGRTIDYLFRQAVPVITVIRGFPLNNKVKSGYFVVNIRKDAFFDVVGKNNNVVIMDKSGKVIKNDAGIQQTDFSIDGFRGFSIDNVDGKRSMLVYIVSPYNGWKYISIIDDRELLAPIDSVRRTIIEVIIICLIGGIIASLLTSHNVYTPIGEFIDRLLQKRLTSKTHIGWLPYKENEIAIINDYIEEITRDRDTTNRLLETNKETLNAIALIELLEKGPDIDPVYMETINLLIPYKAEDIFVVMIAAIDNFKSMFREYGEQTINSYRKHIKELSQQISDNALLSLICVDVSEDKAAIVVKGRAMDGDIIQQAEILGSRLISQLDMMFGFTITIGIGEPVNYINNINRSYQQALQALKYKIIKGKGVVLSFHKVDSSKKCETDEYCLIKKGQELARGIMKGDQACVTNLMNDIVIGLKEGNIHIDYIPTVLSYVLTIVLNTVFILEYKLIDICGKDYHEIHSRYYELETVEEMENYITGLAMQIAKYVYGKQHVECSIILDTIKKYIMQNYADENLSLQNIADMVHMSVSYVSSLFKKETGIGFSEFLSNIRIEKAKELLSTTHKNMDEISRLVGYSNSHSFYIMFKRITGMSPSAYKKLVSVASVGEQLDNSIQNKNVTFDVFQKS